jgi:hypothetical protein
MIIKVLTFSSRWVQERSEVVMRKREIKMRRF